MGLASKNLLQSDYRRFVSRKADFALLDTSTTGSYFLKGSLEIDFPPLHCSMMNQLPSDFPRFVSIPALCPPFYTVMTAIGSFLLPSWSPER